MENDDTDIIPLATRLATRLTGDTAIVFGTDDDDIIGLSSQAPADWLIAFAGAGNDIIASPPDTETSWIFGGLGDDFNDAESPNNAFVGGLGNDQIYAGPGDDYFRGGAGDDMAVFELSEAGSGSDRFYGGPGNDTLTLLFTGDEWHGDENLRLDIRNYASFLADQPDGPQILDAKSYTFAFLDLTVQRFDQLKVGVDGVEVDPFNLRPDAVDDHLSTNRQMPPNLLDNDTDPEGDALTVTEVNGAAANVGVPITLGSGATLRVDADGSVDYHPLLGFAGGESFTYTASDGELSDTAIATVTVGPTNTPPVAVPDSFTGTQNASIHNNVVRNDSDADGDPITPILVRGAENGTVWLDQEGCFTYMPNPDFYGTDTLLYKLTDGQDESEIVTVTFTVEPINGGSDLDTSDTLADPDPSEPVLDDTSDQGTTGDGLGPMALVGGLLQTFLDLAAFDLPGLIEPLAPAEPLVVRLFPEDENTIVRISSWEDEAGSAGWDLVA